MKPDGNESTMPDTPKETPACFGKLENVFPHGTDGLRSTPESCFPCCCKTACLRTALGGREGHRVLEERLDRAYATGRMGFFERWARRKALRRRGGNQ
jgi:hypothetical protein